MWPKVSEKTKRTCKGITLSIKLEVIKGFSYGVWNKDFLCASKLWTPFILFCRCGGDTVNFIAGASSGSLGWKLWRLGDSQYAGGMIWGKHSQAAEDLSSSCWGWLFRGLLLLGGHVDYKVHHPVAIAKLIVIPENELDKVLTEGNASLSIEGGGLDVTIKVTRQPGRHYSPTCPWRGPLRPPSLPSWCHCIWQLS